MKLFTGALLAGSLLLTQFSFAGESSEVYKSAPPDNSVVEKVEAQQEMSEGMLVAKLALKKYLNGKGNIFDLTEKSRSVSNLGSMRIYTFSISDNSGNILELLAKVETVTATNNVIINIFKK